MIIFNSLLAQLIIYDVHKTHKMKSIHAISYHILLYYQWIILTADDDDDDDNVDRGSKVPSPPAGHKWKEVRHDNTVSISLSQ